MEFSFEPRNSTSSSSNSRLQKAIERNRAKVARKEASKASSSRTSRLSSVRKSVARPEDVEFTSTGRASSRTTSARYATSTSPRTRSRVSSRATTRRSPVKRKAVIASSPMAEKFKKFLIYLAWGAYFIFLIKLLVASGGIYDFYQRDNSLNNKISLLEDIKIHNIELEKEINLLKKNSGYQKKVIRENLGFISKDEYLILFPKEK